MLIYVQGICRVCYRARWAGGHGSGVCLYLSSFCDRVLTCGWIVAQNLALNVAEKGFKISVFNRSSEKTDACVARASKEGLGDNLKGFKDMKDFVMSLERPRRVIILVKAGAPVDATIEALSEYMEPGDIIIDGGNEWYENTERRQAALKEKGIIEIGMGVSGGEEGARRGPAMMPGGDAEAYSYLAQIVEKVAAQTDDGPCVTYIGPGGSGNFVKMVHNGIEYGDMQLIAEAYDVLKTVGGLSNEELAQVFDDWNKSELESFLIQITAAIFKKKDEQGDGFLVDKVLDKTGMKVCAFSLNGTKKISAHGLEPWTSGLWAPHATTAPS